MKRVLQAAPNLCRCAATGLPWAVAHSEPQLAAMETTGLTIAEWTSSTEDSNRANSI